MCSIRSRRPFVVGSARSPGSARCVRRRRWVRGEGRSATGLPEPDDGRPGVCAVSPLGEAETGMWRRRLSVLRASGRA